jgi:predicted nucleic acid-binding protein
LEVLTVPHIRARHGLSDDELLEFLASLLVNAVAYPGQVVVPASLPRDPTDAKFLALADESKANYLVTRDCRHLLRLGRFGPTRIVTPGQFLRQLS